MPRKILKLDSKAQRYKRAWILIARFLPPYEVMLKLPHVSKVVYKASRDEGLWKELLLFNYTADFIQRIQDFPRYLNPITGIDYTIEKDFLSKAFRIEPK